MLSINLIQSSKQRDIISDHATHSLRSEANFTSLAF
jgi:hypothetical protein